MLQKNKRSKKTKEQCNINQACKVKKKPSNSFKKKEEKTFKNINFVFLSEEKKSSARIMPIDH